jgi:hypothetical protein
VIISSTDKPKQVKRRDFIQLTGLGLGALTMPVTLFGHSVDAQQLLTPGMDVAQKKQLADVALQSAKSIFTPGKIKYRILSTANLLVPASGYWPMAPGVLPLPMM